MSDDVKASAMNRDELMAALNRAAREVSGQAVLFSQALADHLGVGSSDLECLDIVLLHGPLTAGELARRSGLTSGAITGVIDRLEKAGFAARETDAADRRKVLVRALPAIEARAAPAVKPMEDANVALLSGYSDKELALLLDYMTRSHASAVEVTVALRAQTGASRQGRK
jgi:DNA-binding MarR family transcriptional regulator